MRAGSSPARGTNFYAAFVYRLGHKPFTFVRWVRFPYAVPRIRLLKSNMPLSNMKGHNLPGNRKRESDLEVLSYLHCMNIDTYTIR